MWAGYDRALPTTACRTNVVARRMNQGAVKKVDNTHTHSTPLQVTHMDPDGLFEMSCLFGVIFPLQAIVVLAGSMRSLAGE